MFSFHFVFCFYCVRSRCLKNKPGKSRKLSSYQSMKNSISMRVEILLRANGSINTSSRWNWSVGRKRTETHRCEKLRESFGKLSKRKAFPPNPFIACKWSFFRSKFSVIDGSISDGWRKNFGNLLRISCSESAAV